MLELGMMHLHVVICGWDNSSRITSNGHDRAGSWEVAPTTITERGLQHLKKLLLMGEVPYCWPLASVCDHRQWSYPGHNRCGGDATIMAPKIPHLLKQIMFLQDSPFSFLGAVGRRFRLELMNFLPKRIMSAGCSSSSSLSRAAWPSHSRALSYICSLVFRFWLGCTQEPPHSIFMWLLFCGF